MCPAASLTGEALGEVVNPDKPDDHPLTIQQAVLALLALLITSEKKLRLASGKNKFNKFNSH
jgi:hypothetical protein